MRTYAWCTFGDNNFPTMKKTQLLAIGCTGLLAVALMANSAGVAEHQGKDRTGAPGSDQPCSQCHNSGSFSPQPVVYLTDVEETTEFTFYLPGETMRLRFEVGSASGAAGFGLQATALLSDNSNAGTFSNPSANGQLEDVAGRHIFEHNDLSGSNTFTVDWTAPPAGSGPVTVYVASLAANGNGGTAGDGFGGGSLVISEGASVSVCGPDCGVALEAPEVRNGAVEWTTDQSSTVQAFNLGGQLVHTWTLRPGANRLPLHEMPDGHLILTGADGRVLRVWNP